MSLDNFVDPSELGCPKCGDKECGTCKTCGEAIVSGITCCGCAKSAKELNGWWYNDVNHGYKP